MPPEKALFPQDEPARHQALKVAALATGLGDKAVSLFYEKRLHTETSEVWTSRCRQQIADVLAVLEEDRASRTTDYWFGGRMGHADIAVATVLAFVVEAHPGLMDLSDFPGLNAHAARLEALPAFQAVKQPFIPPA